MLERLDATSMAVRDLAPALTTFKITPEHLASEEAAQALLSDIRRGSGAGRCLYVLQVCDANLDQTHLANFQDRFAAAKDRASGSLAFPRLNKVEPSRVLYVGSSLTLSSRIKEHLGYGSDRTFALRLNSWVPACEIDLLVAAYDRDASNEAVLLLEDTLWRRLTPMFGRSGSAR
ncbi:hypothetical protein [Brevundimonas diminuta]|uniref:hypothetical protein n=1 Tax=Brevundimonas diminuta TaxID=293 RepID=UPI001F56DFDF|nr:hypothetical protein [Brevundimonas diminuta]